MFLIHTNILKYQLLRHDTSLLFSIEINEVEKGYRNAVFAFCSSTSSRYCPTNQNRYGVWGMVEQLIFNLENEIETNLFSAPASGCYVMMSKLLRNTKVDTVLT